MNDSLTRAKDLWTKGLYGQSLREIVIFLFAVYSIGSIFSRGLLWFAVAAAIIMGVDSYDHHKGEAAGLKSTLGLFLVFIVLGGVLMYLLFGFAPYVTTVQAGS